MSDPTATTTFTATLQRAAEPGPDGACCFVVLPKSASETLPRRGRTSVEGRFGGAPFAARLEPDGQLSHWLAVDAALQAAAGVDIGDTVTVTMRPVDEEPEPALPDDFAAALRENPDARAVWDRATPLAHVDWIHWMTSAKQAKTRAKRIAEACDKLASGQRAVCCFDPSGYYSKAFKAPRAAG